MEKEYCEITKDDPFFEGHFTKEKLLKLIELMEKEGWKFKGDKKCLGMYSSGSGFTGSKYPEAKTLAILEREKKVGKNQLRKKANKENIILRGNLMIYMNIIEKSVSTLPPGNQKKEAISAIKYLIDNVEEKDSYSYLHIEFDGYDDSNWQRRRKEVKSKILKVTEDVIHCLSVLKRSLDTLPHGDMMQKGQLAIKYLIEKAEVKRPHYFGIPSLSKGKLYGTLSTDRFQYFNLYWYRANKFFQNIKSKIKNKDIIIREMSKEESLEAEKLINKVTGRIKIVSLSFCLFFSTSYLCFKLFDLIIINPRFLILGSLISYGMLVLGYLGKRHIKNILKKDFNIELSK